MENKEVRIKLEHISKKFKIGTKKKESFLGKILNLTLGVESKKEFFVLNDVSFEVKAGEIIGIIGKNGAGKSTLLRVIAGIYTSDSGILKTNGRVVYLSGFGSGLKTKLTMAENIFLIGSLMGLSQKDLRNKFDEIVEFSGLKEYVNTKVYQFSDGMVSRLNFSIGIHCLLHKNPEILLIDEVFGGGGDIDFQKKAIAKMEELIKCGASVIIVSHSLDTIKKYCDKALLLEKGKIVLEDVPERVVGSYLIR